MFEYIDSSEIASIRSDITPQYPIYIDFPVFFLSDCLRKAIFYAPIQFKHYGLLSLANIFHRSHNSHDAVAALDLALKYTPENPAIHFTLGNVQATIMQFNQSIKSYRCVFIVYCIFLKCDF